MRRRSRAFTLVELMVVITVICILMAIAVPIVSAAINRSRAALTVSLVGLLQQACAKYEAAYQRYPWLKAAEVREKMAAGKADEVEIKTTGVYAELSGRGAANRTESFLAGVPGRCVKDLGSGRTLVDGWGREIKIRIAPDSGEIVIWSFGRDGKDETNDGASTDPARFPKIYYCFGSGGTGDDKGTQ